MENYLLVNRAIGIVSLLGFLFFCCAVAAIQGSAIKADFQEWKRLRAQKKAQKPVKKGLHR